jgi:hypothetical protein
VNAAKLIERWKAAKYVREEARAALRQAIANVKEIETEMETGQPARPLLEAVEQVARPLFDDVEQKPQRTSSPKNYFGKAERTKRERPDARYATDEEVSQLARDARTKGYPDMARVVEMHLPADIIERHLADVERQAEADDDLLDLRDDPDDELEEHKRRVAVPEPVVERTFVPPSPADRQPVRTFREPTITAPPAPLAAPYDRIARETIERRHAQTPPATAASVAARARRKTFGTTSERKTPLGKLTVDGAGNVVAVPMPGSAWDDADLLNAADKLACTVLDLVICNKCNRARKAASKACPACRSIEYRVPNNPAVYRSNVVNVPTVKGKRGRRATVRAPIV